MVTVYFLKADTTQFVVGATPVNLNDYIAFDVTDDTDLSNVSLQMVGDDWYLTTLPPSPNHIFNGVDWEICPDKVNAQRLAQCQRIKDAINILRDQKINGGVYVQQIDKWIDSDARAERNLLSTKASFDLFGDDVDIVWTCADNTIIKLTKAIMLYIWQALLANKQQNHANALKHKTAVEHDSNPPGYDYSTGWSKTYQDFVKELKEQSNGN